MKSLWVLDCGLDIEAIWRCHAGLWDMKIIGRAIDNEITVGDGPFTYLYSTSGVYSAVLTNIYAG